MNGKISSGQVLTIEVGLIIALFPGVVNTLILNTSRNASLISIMIAIIIGFIPVLMIILISKRMTNQSLKEYMIEKLGIFGKILNLLLILIATFILFLNSWLLIDFIISQFLTRTSYYFIAGLLFTIIAWTINKGIETASRTIFVLFIFVSIIMFSLWACLIPYTDLNNLKPYIDVETNKIIKSSIIDLIYITMPIIYILDLKHITTDKKNFERKIIIAYIIAALVAEVFLFFIISVYGINLATILTYPVYSLFKKIQILGFIERIENFAAIQIIVAFYIQSTYLIYYIKENITGTLKITNKKNINIITYLIALIIPITSIVVFKNHNLINVINISPYIMSSIIIVIILLFIFSINKKNLEKN